ncbi:glycosyltransferase [Candidatus Borrarchaeum sp.]|uniref:glycosyltransferase n=1 Tax=Candidatus Borrarchaeum sp. TaxID=2846742 RepID=UPI00257BB07E|nr:glycosyltransferase [Candidatus Borrarchaeum sp.]
MRILQVTNFFKPSWEAGGPAKITYELSKKLLERGHEVTVYTTDGFKRRLNVEKNRPVDVDGIRTYYFRNLSKSLVTKISTLPYYAPLIARKEITDFDIIHINELNMLGFLVHRYAKKYKIPYVLQGHGSLFFKISGRVTFSSEGNIVITKKRLLGRMWNVLFERPTLYNASKIIALTEKEAEECKKINVDENRIVIIPNGINLNLYENLPKRGEFRSKYSIKDNERLILYLGRIHKIKGINLLIKAFASLLKELKDVRLVIVGPDDGFMPTLMKHVRESNIDNRILFTGPLYEKEKLTAYVDADVYVLPSIYETFPNTILEAWACGTPVIVTNRCGIADFVDKVGYVVKYNEDQLRGAISKIISDEELRKRIGAESKKLVRKEFSLDKVIGKIEALYETILAK